MASIVREVLSAMGTLDEKDDFCKKAFKLNKKLTELKAELRDKVECNYINFIPNYEETASIILELESAIHEYELLQKSINTYLKPNINENKKNLQDLVEQLNGMSTTILVSRNIKNAYIILEEISGLLEAKKYIQACQNLKSFKDIHIDEESADFDQKQAFFALQNEYIRHKSDIHFNLGLEWEQNVEIKTSDKSDWLAQFRVGFISSHDDERQNAKLSQLITAMDLCEILKVHLRTLGFQLISLFVTPIVKQGASTVVEKHSLVIRSNVNKSCSVLEATKSTIENLRVFFGFLAFAFNIKVENSLEPVLVRLIGQLVSADFVKLYIEDCLTPAVPSCRDNLSYYDEIIKLTETFQAELVEIGFLEGDGDAGRSILEFARNFEVTFVHKLCQNILQETRRLTKRSLQESVYLEASTENGGPDANNFSRFNFPVPEGLELDFDVFAFPACRVSQSVIEIRTLIVKTMEEAISFTPTMSVRLLQTTRKILHLFAAVLPIAHAVELTHSARSGALAHNNCFYLAHQAMFLSAKYKHDRTTTFVDLVPKLRDVGTEIFLATMRSERDTLLGLVEAGNLSKMAASLSVNQDEGLKLCLNVEECFNQIITKLAYLKTSWQDVLPHSVYCKSTGTILNSVAEKIISVIVNLEHISANAAVQLSHLISSFQVDITGIYSTGEPAAHQEVVRYVQNWRKLEETVFILNGNLQDIEDRWASGKGPLATEFSVEELKQLIRAIFQNTEKRAAVLSSIKFE